LNVMVYWNFRNAQTCHCIHTHSVIGKNIKMQ
jgi:hypothetical protein